MLVRLVREAGEGSGLYGAKITGGGSGGSVCIVGEASAAAEASLHRLLAQYRQATGVSPYVFEGDAAPHTRGVGQRPPPLPLPSLSLPSPCSHPTYPLARAGSSMGALAFGTLHVELTRQTVKQ